MSILTSSLLFAQEWEDRIFASINYNTIRYQTDYVLSDNFEYHPSIGYSFGLEINKPYKRFLRVNVGAELKCLRGSYDATIFDEELESWGDFKVSENQFFISVSFMPELRIMKKIYVRSGIGVDANIISLLHFRNVKKYEWYEEKDFLKDTFPSYLSTWTVNIINKPIYWFIPVQVGYEFGRHSLYVGVNVGISSKHNTEAFCNMYNQTYKIGYGLKF
jgi:hypothetical protein